MIWENPGYLLLLLLLPLLAWRLWIRRPQTAVTFSTVSFGHALTPSLRQRLAWLPPALTLAAIALIILALARPRQGREQTVIDAEGIAIELIVDRSSSMQAMDFQIDGRRVDRLTAVKNVAGKFVTGDDADDRDGRLQGRPSDLVGLVAFAGYADALTPPTLDHAFLIRGLNEIPMVRQQSEDGTAIGDAISLAVEKLSRLDDRRQADGRIASKVAILLTDGENNAGEFDPVTAAELAKQLGIKIYTIGVGTRGRAPVPVPSPFTGRPMIQWMDVNIDEQTLRSIATTTGGKYFRATDTESLAAIYAEIDKLEKSKVETRHFVDYREWAVQPIRWAGWKLPPLVWVALLMLATRIVLERTLLRTFV